LTILILDNLLKSIYFYIVLKEPHPESGSCLLTSQYACVYWDAHFICLLCMLVSYRRVNMSNLYGKRLRFDKGEHVTSLLAWVGVDQRGPASVYMASDSRISWGAKQYWDFGRKLFASTRFPELFGYCGDVAFPSHVLGQTTVLIDTGLLFELTDSPLAKLEKVKTSLSRSLAGYPSTYRRPFSIVYCTRENMGMHSIFHVYRLSWSNPNSWTTDSKLAGNHAPMLQFP
jgi:hypothetical protein